MELNGWGIALVIFYIAIRHGFKWYVFHRIGGSRIGGSLDKLKQFMPGGKQDAEDDSN